MNRFHLTAARSARNEVYTDDWYRRRYGQVPRYLKLEPEDRSDPKEERVILVLQESMVVGFEPTTHRATIDPRSGTVVIEPIRPEETK